ncbi:hypothetical protein FGG08_003435 [Glutinoglossum americanum]|uniref:Uncharacterized protein n=1 Tax=Glutinoglossum americanum TaxID=1670608 RepID=A0A9P8IB19_9PEZI|nr:hypothetical protein FGG08_003435 [Glutinoglossum americanum]
MVKPLTFKGDKKPKKRKRPADDDATKDTGLQSTSTTLQKQQPASSSAATTTTSEDTIWTSADLPTDIAGPTLLAFPSPSPYCIACDANGKVFASAIENIYKEEGGEAQMATAEPHDVRQVWVACRVEGMEGMGFRGHHGRYLSCDKFGILSAHHEAISSEETFLITPHPATPPAFSLQTSRSTYLTLTPPSNPEKSKPLTTTPQLRGDSTTPTPIHIRMQTIHKARLSATKEAKAREKITRRELEDMVGRRLEEEEVRRLKRARKEGGFYEAVLDVRVQGKHDKFAC